MDNQQGLTINCNCGQPSVVVLTGIGMCQRCLDGAYAHHLQSAPSTHRAAYAAKRRAESEQEARTPKHDPTYAHAKYRGIQLHAGETSGIFDNIVRAMEDG